MPQPDKRRKGTGLVRPGAGTVGLEDDAWISVIRKMDEVYADLLRYEVELEETNAALEEKQRFIESVLQSMSDILVACDRAGTIQDVNASLVRLTGRTEQQLRGAPVADLFVDAAARDLVRRIVTEGQTRHDCELGLAAAGGGSVAVSLNFTARLTAHGKPMGSVITGRPVGELRRAYEALRQAHEDLKRAQQQLLHAEKMASLGRLVAGVAHELNNPISFVLGNVYAIQRYADRLQTYLQHLHGGASADDLERLRRELRIDRIVEDLAPLIEGTVEGAERSRQIVDSLKRFSAMDRDESVAFDLAEVIERAVHWVQKAVAPDFVVTIDVPAAIRAVGSPTQLQQVTMNLVQNAFDAVAGCTVKRLRIQAVRDGQRLVVTFHDSGPGLPDDVLPKIFEPFFTTKPVGMGTGLGLSISYGIVRRHGGELTAANHPDGGALFTMTLPAAPETA
jgi:two-component system sensor histidine kinase HupT/HoxJ